MSTVRQDLAIFDKFDFDRKPVAVRFSYWKPDGMEKLDKNMAFCEMFVEAQKGKPFFATRDNFTCAGPTVLGMVDMRPVIESGELGVALEVFKDVRACKRMYPNLPILPRNTVNYVTFSVVDQISFEPDVLIVTANIEQAEILLRAMSYETGKIWSSKLTQFVECAWIYIYPYITGELNYSITGFSYGMKAREVFPDGLILISIPNDLLPTIIRSLKDMTWVLPAYSEGKEEHQKRFDRIKSELSREP